MCVEQSNLWKLILERSEQAVQTVEPETVALVILLNVHLNAKKKRSQYVIFSNFLLIKVFSNH